MLYIHRTTCISPQQTFPETDIDLSHLYPSADNKLKAREPSYEGIPPGHLRRMGKTVRLGIGAALPLLREASTPPDGILIGTANAGMEESIQFMKEIIDHEEGILSPGSFVQSTPNTIAAQLSLLTRNKGYNITHVQAGLAFENALLDAAMLLKEGGATYLVGGVDEIGALNYNIDRLQGCFKQEPVSNIDLYETATPGSLAGEGAAMFLVSNQKEHALAKLEALSMLYSDEPVAVADRLRAFLHQHLPPGERIDMLLSGENGDHRFRAFFEACESALDKFPRAADNAPATATLAKPIIATALPAIARFKHLCGEYPTASAFSLWLACQLFGNRALPAHILKRSATQTDASIGTPAGTDYKRVLIYNSYKGMEHSFMLVAQTPR